MGRRAKVLLGTAAGALTISLSACIGGGVAPGGSTGTSVSPTETMVAAGPVSATRSDDVFTLTISTPRAEIRASEAIEIDTTVTYVGSEPTATISSSGGGPVAFSVAEVGGDRRAGPAVDSACARRTMTRGVPVHQPFAKSGAWSDGDPNADFVAAYVEGPDLKLPPGRWRITAELVAYVGDCTAMGAHELNASIELVVGPATSARAPASTAPPSPPIVPPSTGPVTVGEPILVDFTDQAIPFSAAGYWDVPCSGGPGGEPGSACATPLPRPGPDVERRPLRIDRLDIPLDHVGRYDVIVGTALLPHGLLTRASFEIGGLEPSGTHTDRHGFVMRIVSQDPGAPPFDNAYERGTRPGSEAVDVHLVFSIASRLDGSVLEVRELVVR